jgi:hypothetical protein
VQRGVDLDAVAAEELPGAVVLALRLAPDPIAVVLDNPGSTYRAASACGSKTVRIEDIVTVTEDGSGWASGALDRVELSPWCPPVSRVVVARSGRALSGPRSGSCSAR